MVDDARHDNCPPGPPADSRVGGACSGCPQSHACRDVWSKRNDGPLRPVGLTLASAAAFLVPLVTAIGGGALAANYWPSSGKAPTGEILGALAGLIVGVLIGWVIVPRVAKGFGKQADNRSDSPPGTSHRTGEAAS